MDSEEDESSKSVPSTNDDSSNTRSALALALRMKDESLDQTNKENRAPSSNEAMDTKKTSTSTGGGGLAPLLVNNGPSDTNKGVSINTVVIGTTFGTDTISNVDSPLTMTEAPSNTNRGSLGTTFTFEVGNGSSKPQDAASKDGNLKVGTTTELPQGLNSISSSSSAADGSNQGGGSGVDSFASNKAANKSISMNKNEEGEETTAIDSTVETKFSEPPSNGAKLDLPNKSSINTRGGTEHEGVTDSTPSLGNRDGTVNRDDTTTQFQSSHKKKDGAASPSAKNGEELSIDSSSQLESNRGGVGVELTSAPSPVSVASKEAATPSTIKGNEEVRTTVIGAGFMNDFPLSTGSNGSSMEEDATGETSRDLDEGDGMIASTRCLGTSCCIIL